MSRTIRIVGTTLLTLLIASCGQVEKLNPSNLSQTRLEKSEYICRTSGISLGDSGKSLTIDGDLTTYDDAICVLNILEAPDSMISQMDQTRALDGRQEYTWNNFSASWTYHPDDGLNMVIEER